MGKPVANGVFCCGIAKSNQYVMYSGRCAARKLWARRICACFYAAPPLSKDAVELSAKRKAKTYYGE